MSTFKVVDEKNPGYDDDDYNEDPSGQTVLRETNLGGKAKKGKKGKKKDHFATWTRKSLGFSTWNQKRLEQTMQHASIRATALFKEDKGKWKDFESVQALTVEDEDEVYTDIPSDVTSLTNLVNLSFNWSSIKSVNSGVFSLPLSELRLERNSLKSIDGIGQARHLTSLDLTCNLLESLPDEIGVLENLVFLCVRGNKLKKLPETLGKLKSLKELDCYSNVLQHLPEGMCEAKAIACIDVSRNRLKSLPEHFGKLGPSLVDFRASHNHLTDVPVSASELSSLKSLILSHNRFVEVPKILGNIPKLECVNFQNNQIEAVKCEMSNLKTLLLNNNKLYDFPAPVYSCTKLEFLSLEHNFITEIHADIKGLPSLRMLYLSGNDLTELPDEICELSELRHLSLLETDVTTFPEYFDYLEKLSNLLLEIENLDDRMQLAYRQRGAVGVREYIRELRADAAKNGDPIYVNT